MSTVNALSQVQDWLDYICGRGPPPQTQMPARGKPTERKRGRKKRGAGGTTEDDTDQDLGPYTNQYVSTLRLTANDYSMPVAGVWQWTGSTVMCVLVMMS